MRVLQATATVVFLILLLTWLSLRAINPEAELFDRALVELDRFAMIENALSRDVFAARAGTLRNYDPLVSEVNALRESLGRLRDASAIDARTSAAIDRLAALADLAFSLDQPAVSEFGAQRDVRCGGWINLSTNGKKFRRELYGMGEITRNFCEGRKK